MPIDFDPLETATVKEMATRLIYAGRHILDHHKQMVSVPFNANGPSVPGEYPHLRSSEGKKGSVMDANSVQDVIDHGLKIKLGQKANSFYMVILERQKQRLGFARTANDLRSSIITILGGGQP